MIARRILAALALLCALIVPAQAQKTKAAINAEIGVQFPDQNLGAITPLNLRNITSDIVNSIMPTAPVISGDLACFSGTTGLLADCGSILPVPAGGTGAASFTAHAPLLGQGTSPLTSPTYTIGTVGLPLVSNAPSSDPSFSQIGTAAISGLGTGVATALGINIGSAGAPVLNGGALGSPSSAGTIPAFTLGGAIAGGGNQINNIIIGNSTPLAGSFTTLSASTSVSSPVHAASGALQFQSNGSTFAGSINTSQQWYLGTSNVAPPTTTLATISGNTAQLPAFTQTNVPQLQVSAADGARSMIGVRQFGASAGTLAFAHAGNTAASPTATASGTAIGLFTGYGYQTTTNGYVTTAGAGLQMVATDNFTSTVAGEELQFYTTPTGTAAIALAGKFQASGGFSVGTATDPGIGSIIANKFAQTGAVAVASLPTCNAAAKAARYFVTDANATFTAGIGAAVAAGGANNVPVTCDGTNWRIG